MKTEREQIGLNPERRIYTIGLNGSYSCLGFDVLDERAKALALEMGEKWTQPTGTLEAYYAYEDLLERAKATGRRFKCGLTPQLIGLEYHRVEVVDCYDEKRRFIVGKSTGFIPCHIELARRNSTGGGSVTGAPFKSIRVIEIL